MTVLFPPVIESQAKAFPFSKQATTTDFFEIRFVMPVMVAEKDIRHLQVSLKYASTGEPAVNPKYSPDRQTLFISANAKQYFMKERNGNYVIKIPYRCFAGGMPAKDTTYLVQVRFGSNTLWCGGGATGIEGANFGNFAAWRQTSVTSIPTTFGEWSNIQKAYCYIPADPKLVYNVADFMPEIVFDYSPGENANDPMEQVKIVYQYAGLNGTITNSEVFNGQYVDDNHYIAKVKLNVAPLTNIAVSVEAVTKNNTVYGKTLTIYSAFDDRSHFDIEPVKVEDIELKPVELEDGVLAKKVTYESVLDIEYSVYRINTLNLDCVKIINRKTLLSGESIQFKDYTVEMGIDYQYVVMRHTKTSGEYEKQILLGDPYPFGPDNPGYGRLTRMDCSYLVDKYHQLRLQGNVTLSGLKKNVQDSFQTTIGSKYPYYSRPSKMGYRSFQMNALITVNFDPTATFMRIDGFKPLHEGSVIIGDEYRLLMDNSPGLERYFKKDGEKDSYILSIPERYTNEYGVEITSDKNQVLDLINRCATTIIKNGMWWDDEESSHIEVQDRDLLETDHFSRSRIRERQSGDFIEQSGNHKMFVDLVQRGEIAEDERTDIIGRPGEGPRSKYSDFLHRETQLKYGTNPTDSLVFVERIFREKVMNWLGNGKPKLFRSETEGNMIVITSGASFTPQDKSSRMVYNVSMTVTEIAEFNSENLFTYNLTPTLIESYYSGANAYEFVPGKYDPDMARKLVYEYRTAFDIRNMLIGDASNALCIDTRDAVKNSKYTLVFSAEGLPNGIIMSPNGVITGYPKDISKNMKPGLAALTVKDILFDKDGKEVKEETRTASITIHYGWMYTKLKETTPGKTVDITSRYGFVIGENIDEVPIPPFFEGGLGPYRYSIENPPGGISISADGTVYGQMTGPLDQNYDEETGELKNKDSNVVITDSMGQILKIPIKYDSTYYALNFVHLPTFDFDYLEVTVPVPQKYLPDGVSGGKAGDKTKYTYNFVTGAPKGLKISDGTVTELNEYGETVVIPNGTIYGSPEEPTQGNGEFIVSVTDNDGTTREISISYKRIVPEFKFSWNRDYDINPGQAPIPINSTIKPPGIDLSGGVEGGLPFAGDTPYRFRAEGLAPNFQISHKGLITGKAQVAKPLPTTAMIYVYDQRNEERCIYGRDIKLPGETEQFNYGIIISEITSTLQTPYTKIVISNLREGVPLTDANVTFYDKNGPTTAHTLAIDQIEPKAYRPFIKARLEPELVNGMRLKENEGGAGNIDSWGFEDVPDAALQKKEANAITAQLILTNTATQEILSIPVYFEETIGILRWPYETDFGITIDQDPNTPVSITIPQSIVGGKEPYNIKYFGSVSFNGTDVVDPNWFKDFTVVNPTSPNNRGGWQIKGVMPDVAIVNTVVTFQLTSADGQGPVDYKVLFKANLRPVHLEIIDEFLLKNMILIKGHSKVTGNGLLYGRGGSGVGYLYTSELLKTDANGNIIIVNGLTIDKNTGVVSGTPMETGRNLNCGDSFRVTDIGNPRGRPIAPASAYSWQTPIIIEKPDLHPGLKTNPKVTEITPDEVYQIECGALSTGSTFTSIALFENYAVGVSKIQIDATPPYKELPSGLNWMASNGIVTVSGTPLIFDKRDCKLDLIITGNRFTPAYKKSVILSFKGVPTPISINFTQNTVSAVGVGKTVAAQIGEIMGGIGPFKVEPVGGQAAYPDNIVISVNAADTRKVIFSGVANKEFEGKTLQFTIIDEGNPDAEPVPIPFSFGGIYPPLIVDTSKIPNPVVGDYESGQTIDTVNLEELGIVSGGSPGTNPKYQWKADGEGFANRGYTLTGNGVISGTAGNKSYKAQTITIIVSDFKGQEEKFQIKVGKVDGPISYTGGKTWSASIQPIGPSGRVGGTFSNTSIDLSAWFAGKGSDNVQLKIDEERAKNSRFKQLGGNYTLNGKILRFTPNPNKPIANDGTQNRIYGVMFTNADGADEEIPLWHGLIGGPLSYTGQTSYTDGGRPLVTGVGTLDLSPYIAGDGYQTATLSKSGTSPFEQQGGAFTVSGKKVVITRMPTGKYDTGDNAIIINNIRLNGTAITLWCAVAK